MPSFKNIHKMPVHIYFGDLAPETSFYHDKINEHLFVGPEDYGRFSKKTYGEILEAWNAFKSSHYFDNNLYRWLEKDPNETGKEHTS